MSATVRCGSLVGLLVFCVACDARPTAPSSLFLPRSSTPTTPPTIPTPPTPPAPLPGPPLSGPSTTYHFSASLDYPIFPGSYTATSIYTLYTNGAFSFRYPSLGEGAYTRSYQHQDGRIIFDFGSDGRTSQGGQPEAIGTLNGDLLEVR